MNLRYSILWFDDDSECFDSLDLEPLEKEIRDWGFNLHINPTTDPEEFRGLSPYDKYDLLVVDYNLSNFDQDGDEFIEEIRSHGIFTEIIFYSANPISNLWDAVAKRQLQGVFVSTRGDPLLAKIENVARQSVKKVLDLNNVRGIVMAEVGAMDELLDKLAIAAFSALDDEKKDSVLDQHKKFISKFHDGMKTRAEFANDINTLFGICDSFKRWRLCKAIVGEKDKAMSDKMGGYDSVLRLRNILAHGTPDDKGGALVFKNRGNPYKFTEKESTNLRKDLKKYAGIFEDLCKKFAQS